MRILMDLTSNMEQSDKKTPTETEEQPIPALTICTLGKKMSCGLQADLQAKSTVMVAAGG